MMRFMILLKANADTEAGIPPSEDIFEAMGAYNQQLVDAGVMLSGEGLHPSSNGSRVNFSGSTPTVTDGPFAETKELLAGFWIFKVDSMDEAIEWVKRCPIPSGTDTAIEIRRIFEAEDFGEAFTPELQAAEERMREQIARQHGS